MRTRKVFDTTENDISQVKRRKLGIVSAKVQEGKTLYNAGGYMPIHRIVSYFNRENELVLQYGFWSKNRLASITLYPTMESGGRGEDREDQGTGRFVGVGRGSKSHQTLFNANGVKVYRFPCPGNTERTWYRRGAPKDILPYNEEGEVHGTCVHFGRHSGKPHTINFVRGVHIPWFKYRKLQKNTLTPQEILREPNQERRRIYLEEYGYERILKDVDAVVMNQWKDYTLFRFCLRRDEGTVVPSDQHVKRSTFDIEVFTIVKVRCATTGAFYCLRVPDTIRTARGAVAWTFNMPVEEYWAGLVEEA